LNKISNQDDSPNIPISLTLDINGIEKSFISFIHIKEEYVLLEFEESKLEVDASKTFIKLYQHIKYITTVFKSTNSVEEISQITAEEVKKMSGFDKVMVYKFDPKWNGQVIAEAKVEDLESFLGLHFPASDVPKQARDLYFTNPYRLIPSREYEPVRLIPVINPLNHRFTDLSNCQLRSIATVHLEYMANMGIMASMSLPIIIKDKLWGLISCHHITPKHLTYEMRSALELLSGVVSVQIGSKELEKSVLLQAELKEKHAKLLEQLYNSDTIADALLNDKTSIQQLLQVSGVLILLDGATWSSGKVPSASEIKELLAWFRRHKLDKVFATDNLPSQFLQSERFKDIASGLIVIPINIDQGEYIIGFREEVSHTIEWGGNPEQAIQMEANGKSYHPRNSFARYQEEVKFTSHSWKTEELEAAQAIQSAVLEKVIRERH
jgi:two-component system, chemotaxis family, sensor kinase Cph1